MIEPESAEQFTFRRATDGDVATIVEFNLQLALETEGKVLNPETMQQGVSRGIQQFPEAQYFIAECERQLVGQLMFTREWSDWRNKWVLWIQSVYVLPEYRKQGVFKQMYQKVKEWAEQDKNISGIRLYVDKTNQRAIEVYKQVGMNGEHYQLFEWMIE